MTTDMVLFAKGPPESKSREMDGQMPFEEWIYGKPPKDVEFVRINGNSVIRVEVAKLGESPVIFTKNEVEGLLRTDGTALDPSDHSQRVAKVGDLEVNPDTQAPATPPSLRKPGEKLPADTQQTGVMRPVQMPKPKPQPSADPDDAAPPRQPLPDASQPGLPKPQMPAPAGTDQQN
jgi:hypothetical protein